MPAITAARIKRTVRKAELESGTGATGFTILKRRSTPIERLVDAQEIAPEQFWAACDIDCAISAISGALTYKCPYSEKVDRGVVDYTPARIIDSMTRYKPWAAHWSKRRVWGDKTLEIVVAAVVDQCPFYETAIRLHLDRGKVKLVTIAGLGDYAARARMVPPALAQIWMNEAAEMFHMRHYGLRLAIIQAKRTS